MDTTSSRRLFLVTVSGQILGFWRQMSGGEKSVDFSKSYDGGDPDPELLAGVPTISDITVTRSFKRSRDMPIWKRYAPNVGITEHSITLQPCDARYVPDGEPITYQGKLAAITPPPVDASSSEAADFSMRFVCRRVD